MQLCLWVLQTYIHMYTYTCVHSTVCIVGLLPSHVFYSPVVPVTWYDTTNPTPDSKSVWFNVCTHYSVCDVEHISLV